jgi:V8-like Glu-specific endopeptidase
MYLASAATIEITKNEGRYKVDTDKGQSGSPVFLKQNKRHIIGIHKGYDPILKTGICTLIN